MEDQQNVGEILKDFASNVTTSKTKERCRILSELKKCVATAALPEPAIKTLMRYVALAFPRYNDNKSRRALEETLAALCVGQRPLGPKHLVILLQRESDVQRKMASSSSTSATPLVVLSVSTTVARAMAPHLEEEAAPMKDLVAAQIGLYSAALATGRKKLDSAAYRKLSGVWKTTPATIAVYADAVIARKEDKDPHVICMAGAIFRFLSSVKDSDSLEKYKKDFVTAYAKSVLASSSPVPQHVHRAAKPLLRHVTRQQFVDDLLPQINRGLLRNPETAVNATASLLRDLTVDLSTHADELLRPLSTQLRSNDDAARAAAVAAVGNLAAQCSDGQKVKEAVEYLVGVFQGKEGKLTVLAHRLSVLEAIGAVASCPVGGADAVDAVIAVATGFAPSLQSEVTESILCSALQQLKPWCGKLEKTVPQEVVDLLKKGLALKTSTAVVRTEYLKCVLAAFRGDTLLQGLDFAPSCLQSMERAFKQQTQSALVTEAVFAASFLSRLSVVIDEADGKLGNFWSLVTDEKKVLASDKFLSSASAEGLVQTALLSERLLLDHQPRMAKAGVKAQRPYYHALVRALLSPLDWTVRRQAMATVNKIMTGLGGAPLARALLAEFRRVLLSKRVFSPDAEKPDAVEGGGDVASATAASPQTQSSGGGAVSSATAGKSGEALPAKIVAEAIKVILRVPFDVDRSARADVAVECFFDAHDAVVVAHSADAWTDIVVALSLNPKELVEERMDQLIDALFGKGESEGGRQEPTTSTIASAVETLCHLVPRRIYPRLTDEIIRVLADSALKDVSAVDLEIAATPEGQLYNREVIKAHDEPEKRGNIKRESKAYSYKEQMVELELQREIDAKKGKKKDLTPKQKELKAAELAKEAVVRSKVNNLKKRLIPTFAILASALSSASKASSCVMMEHLVAPAQAELPRLVRSVLALIKFPLPAPMAAASFVAMKDVIFRSLYHPDDPWLAPLFAYVTLRLMEPATDLSFSGWTDEPIQEALQRAIMLLHMRSIGGLKGRQGEQMISSLSTPSQLSSPAFAYVFPLLNSVLRDRAARVYREHREAAVGAALAVIAKHASLRHSDSYRDDDPEDSTDLTDLVKGPKFLPRAEMMALLIDLVARESGKLQNDCATCLVDVAGSASGMKGCADASRKEIDLLLAALLSTHCHVRGVALKSLLKLHLVLPVVEEDREAALEVVRRIWISKFDPEEEVASLADDVWDRVGLEVIDGLLPLLIRDCTHGEPAVRGAAAAALAAAIPKFPVQERETLVLSVTDLLLETYMDKLTIPPVELDDFGRPLTEAPPDPWEGRAGVGAALVKLAPLFPDEICVRLFKFFVPQGLGDRHSAVQRPMLQAALAIVDHRGKTMMAELLPILDDFLENAPNTQSFDVVRQGVVVLLGTMAKHLDKDDERVKPIVGKLIETLSTPSQAVQEAVANCLPPLVPAIKADAPEMTKRLITLLLEADKYGDRRGAAYGLAGLVKGLGILSLKQLDIISALTEAIQDKKSQRHREGALFGFEMLCSMLGRLFEPYVVNVLPHLLLCFGDSSQHVRSAADDTAKAVMSKLSAHGVKLVLPSLLQALEEDSWRTKTGSVELLGAMAYCAPKQLSSCLPSIVPKLCVVLTDSHPKVAKAGETAIKQIGSVVRNPEIQVIAPSLIQALQNPTKKTSGCLQLLIDTKFVHFIDAASLALVMPVVQRGFQDRSTDTRKMAAQIIGNMYSLTDQKDLSPYLETILPGLKTALLDPVPEVRTVASRALGAMAKGMGESTFNDLLPWLMATLTSEQSSVDRSGAAQGLSEVVGGLGIEKLNSLMPDIVSSAEKTDIQPHVRDGYLMMYIYLPSVFQEQFVGFIGQIIPSILKALADEAEFVRETALRAGQRIVQMYAETAIALFLPELEKGLFDENWRIRFSSVQLLGDLLYRISGVTGKMTTEAIDEDDTFGSEESINCITKALGSERKNRVLAGLYMGRCDTALQVRQSSLHVWKIVVSNTPRTLREILSTLFSLLLGCLASTSYDKRQVAARTLGDLVRKLGERVLPEIIPILEKGLDCEDRPDQRQGVCIGLSEIIGSTSREHVLTFSDSLVPTVRRALCDTLPEVRSAAAQTFDRLHATIGQRALDDILPDLLERLGDDDEVAAGRALDGLRQVMAVKSRVVLPYLVPQLTSPPVNTHALAILSSVAGEALTKHLARILPALMSALTKQQGTKQEDVVLEHCQTVVLSVSDDHGVDTVMSELLEATSNPTSAIRAAAATLIHAYVSKTKLDYTAYVPNLIRGLIKLFVDEDRRVLNASWDALNAVTKNLDDAEMMRHVSTVRQAVTYAASDLKVAHALMPGFCLAGKGISPILPVFRAGIFHGAPDLKEMSAKGLGEVILLTSVEALRPSLTHITGPLIRILGDRFAWNVNVALLETLAHLLSKVGVALKPFLPQLQTTFLKNLVNPHRSVRLQAASALGQLVVIHQRVDPLFNELMNNVKNAEDSGVKDTTLQALRHAITGAGAKVSENIRRNALEMLVDIVNASSNDGSDASSSSTRLAAAGCLGHLLPHLLPHEKENLIRGLLLDVDASLGWEVAHGRGVALFVALKAAPAELVNQEYETKLQEVVLGYVTNDRVPVCQSGLRAVCFYFLALLKPALLHSSSDEDANGTPSTSSVPPSLLQALAKSMNHSSNEIKTLTTSVFIFLAKNVEEPLGPGFLKPVLAHLINGTKEKNSAVRASSEQALVALLRMRRGQDHFNAIMECLDPGPKGALMDILKSLLKVANQNEPREEEMDNSIVR